MLRDKFNELIEQEIMNGMQRGYELFCEQLEDDLERQEYISEHAEEIDKNLDAILDNLNID